jgi:carboxyl-terminal processing protease
MLKDLVKEATALKIPYNAGEFSRSKALLQNNIKAYIARSVYGAGGFYPVFHEKDDEFKQALQHINQANQLGKGFVQLGVKN